MGFTTLNSLLYIPKGSFTNCILKYLGSLIAFREASLIDIGVGGE